MKIWISRYALTAGVIEQEVVGPLSERSMITFCEPFTKQMVYLHPREWHTSEEEARARAATMVERKIKSLERQLKHLRGLR